MAAFALTLTHLILGGSAGIFQWFAASAPAGGTHKQQSRTLGQPQYTPAARPGRLVKHGRLSDRTPPQRHARVPIKGNDTMDARLQRRIQRYGWDLAAVDYESLWQSQLAEARDALLTVASPAVGERVLDIACGTGLVSFEAARAVGPSGLVHGVDLSERMIDAAERRARDLELSNCIFSRMDAESLALPDASFDIAFCALGLMYMPDPEQALREMYRVLSPGGRISLAVWGERSKCGWSAIFPIVDDEVASEVCPLFFRLGEQDTLARLCADAKFEDVRNCRITATLTFANANDACDAAFVGGPVALAWSRFNHETRARVRARYLEAIESWRHGHGYRIPGEFVIAAAIAPSQRGAAV
jgi:ubiquinone/menaquinone biosynthesis C-methylase UbiE